MTNNTLDFVADVGGTNARFALVDNGKVISDSIHNCVTKDYSNTIDAVKSFLEAHGNPNVSRACLAMACPITGDTVKLTNCDWIFSQTALSAALNLSQLMFVNDFTALAMGVPTLSPQQYYTIGDGPSHPHHPIGVMGPGTGFGVSGLVWDGRHWVALQSEGGHMSFAPSNELEMEILRIGWKEYGGRFSTERILSGAGLEFTYRALSQIKGQPAEPLKAADITKQAIENPESLCREVVNIFCGVLGGVAGDWVLALGALGGIYIGGGIIPKLGNIVLASPLRERFEAKARFKNYVSRIPIYVITDSVQVALMGAAAILNDRK